MAKNLVAALVVAVVVLVGVWVTGGVLTNDANTAKALTGSWFVVSGGLVLLVAARRRDLALTVAGTWLVTSAAIGGFLLLTSSVDRVVHEDVLVAAPAATAPAGITPSASVSVVAVGRFRSGEHDTTGIATLLRQPSGRRVLTLTAFETAPGPDLRVRLVPRGGGVGDATDLGRLKGNKGDQQYDVPRAAGLGRVVIWCRAFSVEFGSALLRPVGG